MNEQKNNLAQDPLLPPSELHNIGDGSFVAIGETFVKYFVEVAKITPNDQVLDVGCGTGRMARALTRFLSPQGEYHGIDIVKNSIDWCNEVYSVRHPNFHFHHSDVFNSAYNPEGKVKGSALEFPFESKKFDFVFLTSVFTHMLPADLDRYLSEISRVLKPGGKCFITYFLLYPESLKSVEAGGIHFSQFTPKFAHPYENGCRVDNLTHLEAAIAYPESVIQELYIKHHLNIELPIRYGNWCGRKDAFDFQDVVIATKV